MTDDTRRAWRRVCDTLTYDGHGHEVKRDHRRPRNILQRSAAHPPPLRKKRITSTRYETHAGKRPPTPWNLTPAGTINHAINQSLARSNLRQCTHTHLRFLRDYVNSQEMGFGHWRPGTKGEVGRCQFFLGVLCCCLFLVFLKPLPAAFLASFGLCAMVGRANRKDGIGCGVAVVLVVAVGWQLCRIAASRLIVIRYTHVHAGDSLNKAQGKNNVSWGRAGEAGTASNMQVALPFAVASTITQLPSHLKACIGLCCVLMHACLKAPSRHHLPAVGGGMQMEDKRSQCIFHSSARALL